jgi:hypothetical protein
VKTDLVLISERGTRKEESFGSPPEGGHSKKEGPPGFSLKRRSKRRVFGSEPEREAEEEVHRAELRGRRVRRRPFGVENEHVEQRATPTSSSPRRGQRGRGFIRSEVEEGSKSWSS